MKRKRRTKSLSSTLLSMMAVLTVLQLVTFLMVLSFGGEFSFIRKNAYATFIEKNANRKRYIESMMVEKTDHVYAAAEKINCIVEEILTESGKTVEDIRSDKELNHLIVEESMESLIFMLRQNQVNDAFLILDSGSLYNTESASNKYGVYIRDIDPGQNDIIRNDDLLMEMGNSEIAAENGISLDSEWSGLLDVTPSEGKDLDFFTKNMEIARKSGRNKLYALGQWTGFSRISRSALPSMKYTMPLFSDDGTVYGVIGIGITEKLVQDMMPNSDSFLKEMCYVLGVDYNNNGEYEILMHSGPMFARLVDVNTKIDRTHQIEGEIYDFNYNSEIKSVGNIQEMILYNSVSPYRTQRWALIAIGERGGIMAIYNGLVRMFFLSAIVSLLLCFAVAFFLNRRITRPVVRMVSALDEISGEEHSGIAFESSYVAEIDTLGNSIVRLYTNVRENSSRVSKLIRMLDMGVGVFMCDFADGTVFVGESLIKILEMEGLPDNGDAVISMDSFMKFLGRIDAEGALTDHPVFREAGKDVADGARIDLELMYCPLTEKRKTSRKIWLKFNLMKEKDSVMGLVQDITGVVRERQKIEKERDYDLVTGLLNKRAYLNGLDELFRNPAELKTAAAVMLDLDNLKQVNDTYGHDFGDKYIKCAADALRSVEQRGGIASRLSGDEFNLFLYGYETKDEIRSIVHDVMDKLLASSILLPDGSRYKISASGGIAWYPDHATERERLLKCADVAMYAVKHSTKGSVSEYEEE